MASSACGLTTKSWDSSGIETSHTYDFLNRPVLVKPQAGHGAATEYRYVVSTPTSGPSLSVYQRPSGNLAATLTHQRLEFDGRGRLTLEERVMPDGTWARRSTGYDPAGNVGFHSTWSSQAVPLYKTSYNQYDPWGRPRKITPPEGSHHAVSIRYYGERRIERTATVGTGGSGSNVLESAVTNTEVYDDLGRLFKYWEDDGVTYKLTKYGYDPAGELAWVTQGEQRRDFYRDGRGFLWQECHPEKGTGTENGCTRYRQIDARGNPRRILDGTENLSYDYNGAEQLVRVYETYGGRTHREFVYAHQNLDGNEYGAGKLRSATQHNYYPEISVNLDFPVQETYEYRGVGGRVSDYETRINFNDVYRQSYAYDDLGQVVSQSYPSCSHCGIAAQTPTYTLRPTYSRGYPTALPDWLDSIRYHPNGRVRELRHANGVVTTEAADPWGRNRPGSVSVWQGTAPLYLSGTYRYDGAGNVTGIGQDYYRYDSLGRLVEGTMQQGGFDRRQTYGYDYHGNLTTVSSFSNGSFDETRTFSVLAQSNRLSNASYDNSGNQLTYGLGSLTEYYHWTPEGRMYHLFGPGKELFYAYSASGERVLTYDHQTGQSIFRIRDLSGQVVREFHFDGAGLWTWRKDWIRNGGALVGTKDRQGQTLHAHLDHLGTPRVFSNAYGISVRQRHFHPFGELAAQSGSAELTMGFTGHERDENMPGTMDDLDYMHQRYYSPQMGRFLSVDPVNSADPKRPGSWNKYAYAVNSPVNFVDPDGLAPIPAATRDFFEAATGQDLAGVELHRSVESAMLTRISGASAITLGDNIFYNVGKGHLTTNREIGLLGHELSHVLQFRDKGAQVFLVTYVEEYKQGLSSGLDIQTAYEQISYEVQAGVVQDAVLQFLSGNPDIARKIRQSYKQGRSAQLTASERARIAKALRGVFNPDRQMCHGSGESECSDDE